MNYTDKKTGERKSFPLSYVSWTDAWDVLHTLFQDPIVEIKQFPAFDKSGAPIDGVQVPYLETTRGVMVEVSVTIPDNGHTTTHKLQRFCIDTGNKPIEDPTGAEIQDNISRAFAICVALHGLGLHAYQGEDLPRDDSGNSNGNGSNGKKKLDPLETVPVVK